MSREICFYRLNGFIFRPDKVVHIELIEGEGENAGKFGVGLWFTHDLHPSRRISQNMKQGTIVWFDNDKDRRYQIEQLSRVRRGSVSG